MPGAVVTGPAITYTSPRRVSGRGTCCPVVSHPRLMEFQASLVAKKEKRQLRAQKEDQQAQNFQNK